MLSHIFACIWFNFASIAAAPRFFSSDLVTTDKNTAFRDDPWLPSKGLKNKSRVLQYMASLYWSFGLMSSSGSSEFPQTIAESMFSIITMASGFFLFAYVIGVLNVLLPLSVANRNKTTFKEAAEAVVSKLNSDDNVTSSRVGPRMDDIASMVSNRERHNVQNQPKKVNEISAGGYFGENGLFTKGQRNAYIQAKTSCILYRLSRESLDLPLDTLLVGLIHGVAVQSKFHLMWLRFMVACTVHVAILTPYELAMDSMSRGTVVATIVEFFELVCEVTFAVDVWFSWHVQESLASMELYDQKLHNVYKRTECCGISSLRYHSTI
ncbi:unnamed protein product [Phytophthora lilii]|uniref:Unnamed protein product n=1 Tax=Phytophthora lilii TaxID=2077276 RepID=A0A9W7D7C7_9STRA|nr:unnamed protein product [Phytophthora lilii]